MPENDRLSGCLDEIDVGSVEREATPRLLMELGIQLHVVGSSLSNTVSFLEVFGVDRVRSTVHNYEVNGATPHYDEVEDRFYLHVRTKPTVGNDDADTGDGKHVSVLAVELGITTIATTSTGRFWGGGELNHWHREYEKRPGDLQQTGTRWAHENVQRVGHTETGRFERMPHTISNELGEEAPEHDRTRLYRTAWSPLDGVTVPAVERGSSIRVSDSSYAGSRRYAPYNNTCERP